MSFRVLLRTPDGVVVRDVVHGNWAEPAGDAALSLGEGLWALPGLVDAHAHLPTAELRYEPGSVGQAIETAKQSLRAGVNLILDKGWTDDVTMQVIDQVPPEMRPEIEAAAQVIASPGGHFPNFALETEPPDFKDAVRAQATAGAGWVKLIGDWPRRGIGPVANFDKAQLESAVAIAGSVGAKVAIHTMAPEVPSQAVAAGVHSIEHGLFLEETDLDALGRRAGMWVPTILRCEATLAQLGAESSGGRLFTEGLRRIQDLLPLAVEAGVFVLAGTDLVGSPANVAAEGVKLGEYGLTNAQVVESLSSSGYRATGRSSSFEPGTPADAVLFPVNPVEDLAVLEHPAHVIRLGRVL